MEASLKANKTFLSILWVFLERSAYSAISFLSIVVFARLLTPEDFGLIGTVAFLISVAGILIESGFGAALVKASSVTHEEYSSIFIFNVVISALLYSILWLTSGLVAAFFGQEILVNIIRSLGLILIFNAITLTQRVHIIRNLQLRKQALISIGALLISVISGISLAVSGCGVWSLVAQQVMYSFAYFVIIVLSVRFRPTLFFSFQSCFKFLSFGGRIVLSSGLQAAYADAFAAVISKMYDFSLTGLYAQSQRIVNFPMSIFRSLYDGAVFPMLSRTSGVRDLVVLNSKLNRSIYMVAFPILLVIPINPELIITVVLGIKWLGAATILSILSSGVLAQVVYISSMNAIKSNGNSKLYLRIGLYRAIIGGISMLVALPFGFLSLVSSIVVTDIVTSLLVIRMLSLELPYSIKSQISDALIPVILSILALVLSRWLVSEVSDLEPLSSLILFMCLGATFYVLLGFLLGIREFRIAASYIRESLNRFAVNSSSRDSAP